jgi:TPR repeat protein
MRKKKSSSRRKHKPTKHKKKLTHKPSAPSCSKDTAQTEVTLKTPNALINLLKKQSGKDAQQIDYTKSSVVQSLTQHSKVIATDFTSKMICTKRSRQKQGMAAIIQKQVDAFFGKWRGLNDPQLYAEVLLLLNTKKKGLQSRAKSHKNISDINSYEKFLLTQVLAKFKPQSELKERSETADALQEIFCDYYHRPDTAKANQYTHLAALFGNLTAIKNMAVFYLNKKPPQNDNALVFLQKAAAEGNQECEHKVAYIIAHGTPKQKRNPEKAIKILEGLVNNGYTPAENSLKTLQQYFKDESQDRETRRIQSQLANNNNESALESYLSRIRKNNDPNAMYNAGCLFMKPRGNNPADPERGLALIKQAAKMGDRSALCCMGDLALERSDKITAQAYFQRAAKLSDPDAMCSLADLLEGKEALKFYLAAATSQDQHNDLEIKCYAQFHAALIYKDGGKGQVAIPYKALDLFLKAASNGHADSMYHAGRILQDGFKEQRIKKRIYPAQIANPKKALTLLLQAAQQDHVPALCLAASALQIGFQGQAANKPKAFTLYKKAAFEHLNTDAMINLAFMLITDLDQLNLHPIPDAALIILRMAICLGSTQPVAMHNLANLLLKKFKREKKVRLLEEALSLYLAAAKKGISIAWHNAATLYESYKNDPATAFKLYQKGIAAGLSVSMHAAALLLETGLPNQNPDIEAARKLHQRAADKNNTDAMISLATLTMEHAEPNDTAALDTALFWLYRARSLGNKKAREYIEIIHKQTSKTKQQKNNDKELIQLLTDTSRAKQCGMCAEGKGTSSNIEQTLVDINKENYISPYAQQAKLTHLKIQIKKTSEREKAQKESALKTRSLSKEEQKIAYRIGQKDKTLTLNDLRKLFASSFFNGQIQTTGTKKGGTIIARIPIPGKNKYASIGMHRKHGTSTKGLHPAFLQNLGKLLLTTFGVSVKQSSITSRPSTSTQSFYALPNKGASTSKTEGKQSANHPKAS